MTLSDTKVERLSRFFAAIPISIAVQLAEALEADRAGGGSLPHDDLLKALTPRLAEPGGRAPQIVSPRKLLFAPFDDLVQHTPRRRKVRGRIAATSVMPVWSWLSNGLLPPAAMDALTALSGKIASGQMDNIDRDVALLQADAAAAILAEIPEPSTPHPRAAAAARLLGSGDIARDAYDMARMMEVGPFILQLQQTLPKRIHALLPEHIESLKAVWETVSQDHAHCAPYLVFLLMGRLDHPWEVLRLNGAISRKMDDALISRTDAGFAGELLLSDIEDSVDRLKPMRGDQMDADTVIDCISLFGNTSTGMVREMGIKREGPWGKRMTAARAGISSEVERMLGRASRDIVNSLPLARKGGFGSRAIGKMADLAKTFDRLRAARAITYARVVAAARPHGAAGAFSSVIDKVMSQSSERLRLFTESMLDHVPLPSDHHRANADAMMDHSIELTRILLGGNEADLMQRRLIAAKHAVDEAVQAA